MIDFGTTTQKQAAQGCRRDSNNTFQESKGSEALRNAPGEIGSRKIQGPEMDCLFQCYIFETLERLEKKRLRLGEKFMLRLNIRLTNLG